jgi:ATP-dependent protease HslVU (ClpYQ) peptidase subunit
VTTIAYRDGILAGDTRITEGDTVVPEVCRKVFKLESGALFGAAGDVQQTDELLNALEKSHPTPELRKALALLIVPDRDVFLYEGKRWVKCGAAPYHAIGSGSNFALAAMWCGKDAIGAVRCGMTFDTNSGGEVLHVKLGKK